ncbi:hypothetical protein HHK36_020727 [Tetracentron sinense]|uniref:Uncharacterized protein n=1 Tax=Tetracentron sinense TaxID=13715 RepID=A0A835DBB1_TETSI|nr:hypothetical protein HHK36_020727 [Tetracentron sinense]
MAPGVGGQPPAAPPTLTQGVNPAPDPHGSFINAMHATPDLHSFNARQAIFASNFAVLLMCIGLEYQGKDLSPFDTDPVTMYTFFIVLLIHMVASVTELGLSVLLTPTTTNYLCIVSKVSVFTGALAKVLLASLLMPASIRLVIYFLCILITSILGFYCTFPDLCKSWFQATKKAVLSAIQALQNLVAPTN